MKREIRTWDWTCDHCKFTERIEGDDAPKGWVKRHYYCDEAYCTGHTEWLCPMCGES